MIKINNYTEFDIMMLNFIILLFERYYYKEISILFTLRESRLYPISGVAMG
jgi:hypothetical protein